MLRRAVIMTSFALVAVVVVTAGESRPDRSKGLSLHLLPKRVADISGQKWGLVSDIDRQVLQTSDEFLSFFRSQSSTVQENGAWIVVTDPDAYGEQERKLLSAVEALCRRQKILLFIARASDLPGGWKRSE